MESAPNDKDFDIDDEKDSERPKTRASNLSDRATAVLREGVRLQPFIPETDSDPEKSNLWRRLLGGDAGTAAPAKKETAEQTKDNAAERTERDDSDNEAIPLTALSPEEEIMVVAQLVEADSLADAATDGETPELQAEPDDPAVTEALDHFHDDILSGNKSLPEAFAGTLDWIEAGADSPDAVPDEPLAVPPSGNDGPQGPTNNRRVFVQPQPEGPNYFAAPLESTLSAAPAIETAPGYDKADVVGAAVVSGLVGYLVGKRRGRIKTEKRLIPVQKKLEKQVKGLRQDIKKKEGEIRDKAVEFARERQRLAAPIRGPGERAQERDMLRAIREGNEAAAVKAVRGGESVQSDAVEQPSSHRTEKKHLGQILVTAAEAIPLAVAATEVSKPDKEIEDSTPRREIDQPAFATAEWASKPAGKARAERAPLVSIDKHVDTMSNKDLLELSSKIIVDGVTLKQAFESHQVGEKGLRRMVSEHLRGGDVRESLHKESVEHEIDFERDPQLRDQGSQDRKRPANSGASQGLQTMIQRADASFSTADTDNRTAEFQTRAEHEAKRQSKHKYRARQSHLVDASLLSIIAILIGLIIMLIINHG